MPIKRVFKHAVIILAVLNGALGAREAGAQSYPARDITFVVAFAPGGVADTLARFVGKGLSERLGRTVVVENRGGAGGNIAAAAVSRATPDGYTLLVTTTAVAINETLAAEQRLRRERPEADRDRGLVAGIASSLARAIRPPILSISSKTAKGKNITFGSAGVGSGSHIAAEYFFKEIAKISAAHVPFQGGAPAIAATIGNQIDCWRRPWRRCGGADRAAASSRAWRRQCEARGRDAERADLCGGRPSVRSVVLGRGVRAGRHQPGDHRQAQRDH